MIDFRGLLGLGGCMSVIVVSVEGATQINLILLIWEPSGFSPTNLHKQILTFDRAMHDLQRPWFLPCIKLCLWSHTEKWRVGRYLSLSPLVIAAAGCFAFHLSPWCSLWLPPPDQTMTVEMLKCWAQNYHGTFSINWIYCWVPSKPPYVEEPCFSNRSVTDSVNIVML